MPYNQQYERAWTHNRTHGRTLDKPKSIVMNETNAHDGKMPAESKPIFEPNVTVLEPSPCYSTLTCNLPRDGGMVYERKSPVGTGFTVGSARVMVDFWQTRRAPGVTWDLKHDGLTTPDTTPF